MKRLVHCVLFGVILSLCLGMVGCEKKTDLDKVVDDATEKTEDAADAVKDVANDAADKVKDVTGD